MLTVTCDDIIGWRPCWDHDRVRSTLAGQAQWSALDFIGLYDQGALDASECLWCVLHESLIPARTLHLLACDFADATLTAERRAGREPHPDSWAAIRVKRDWVDGKATDDERAAAAAAADAAWAAWATAAAWSAAWSAAAEAAAAAAEAAWAAWVARSARSAAWDAAWAADADAEAARKEQVEQVEQVRAALAVAWPSEEKGSEAWRIDL